ncbi:MAG: SufE family protein [Paludibacteraceae bacterium]|nr:SufE family protein [Paludibacteraceae bacterium]
MSINEIQDEIIEEFSALTDWMDRYSLLIDYGNSLPEFSETERTNRNLIEGCQSSVWITACMREGKVHYDADSDAILVKGIVALLLRVLNDQTPQDILSADLYFIERINLREHLSPTRSNGLLAMLKQMKEFALVFASRKS